MDNKPKATAALLASLSEQTGGREDGFFRTLDERHSAILQRAGGTLVVTFERVEEVAASDKMRPLGHELLARFGWSSLTLLAEAETWFRGPALEAFFDEMVDDGLFDAFDQVIFFGAGTSGYAACAYSVAAPGAQVVAISPQATLDPVYAIWDNRFPAARRVDFTTRYGYAPRMCDGAQSVHIFYDPYVREDACHAAQFNQPHIHHHRLRHYGENPSQAMGRKNELIRLMALFDEEEPEPHQIARVFRTRRENTKYLRRLVSAVARRGHSDLAIKVCRFVLANHGNVHKFEQILEQLEGTGDEAQLKTA